MAPPQSFAKPDYLAVGPPSQGHKFTIRDDLFQIQLIKSGREFFNREFTQFDYNSLRIELKTVTPELLFFEINPLNFLAKHRTDISIPDIEHPLVWCMSVVLGLAVRVE